MSKLVLATSDHTGAHIQHLTVAGIRIIISKDGAKTLEVHLTSSDPSTDVRWLMSEAEGRDLRDGINKEFPSLTSVKGSKS